ncbi:MAG: hypothetical protein ACLFNW_12500 [Desulfobacterales bacterium]
MICYPSSDNAVPLIVAGPQRSGTRFVTNVLNSVPGVTLQGEIPQPVMERLVDLAWKSGKKYSSDKRNYVRAGWDASKYDFMFAAWANLTKGRRKKAGKNCIFYGYKSPFHEKYFDFYNEFFHPVRPKYVCCVRSFPGHYFSVNARWPDRSVARVARRYVTSLNQLRYIKEKRPEDVLFFFLDDYKARGFEYLREKILDPLGLKDTAAAEKRAAKGPANASAQLGLEKMDRFTRLQSLFLRIYPHPLEKYEALHHDFG